MLARVDASGTEFGSERLAIQTLSLSDQGIVWDGSRYVVASIDRLYLHGEVAMKSGACALDTTPPGCPSGLDADVVGRDVALTWTPAVDAEFGIERQIVRRDGLVIAVVDPGAASWTDPAPGAGNRSYSIGAINGGYLQAVGCASVVESVPLFRDGFESGNFTAWSSAVP